MKSYLYHLQVNIDFKNVEFYRDLMGALGWNVIFESEGLIGFRTDKNGDVWYVDADRKTELDYDAVGVNHISIRVEELKNVDEIVEFLKTKDVKTLFDTPKHREEFAAKDSETYYQIMFESVDGILFEIVYIGKK